MIFKKRNYEDSNQKKSYEHPKENNYNNEHTNDNNNEIEGMYLGKFIRRLKGINGQWNVAVRRYKNEVSNTEEGDESSIIIRKRILVYITIPIIRGMEDIESKITDIGEMTVSKGKIYTEKTDIDGIKLLCGVISIKNENHIGYISYVFLNRILKLMFNK